MGSPQSSAPVSGKTCTPRSRRGPRSLAPLLFAAAAITLAAAPQLRAQPKTPYDTINAAAAQSEVTVTPLRGGVNLLQGSGGNIGALADPKGAIMVDAGIAVSEPKLKAALERLGATQVRYVIITHWHWDHTDGDGWLHRAGATLVAHPNTVRNLSSTIRVEEWGHTFTPVPAADRPTVLVASEKTFKAGGETILVRSYKPSHTDGDLSVYFTKADVLFTGDTWWNGLYPFIDYKAGGGIDGMIRAADANIAMAGPKTIVVPGHGPAGGRADLVAYREMLVAIREKVAGLKHKGLTLEQTVAAKPTQAFDAKWGKAIISPALFTQLVYRGV
jgi:glyoxylase-like metal-dependent hydrolase (beta-lactamase superfamily II)